MKHHTWSKNLGFILNLTRLWAVHGLVGFEEFLFCMSQIQEGAYQKE